MSAIKAGPIAYSGDSGPVPLLAAEPLDQVWVVHGSKSGLPLYTCTDMDDAEKIKDILSEVGYDTWTCPWEVDAIPRAIMNSQRPWLVVFHPNGVVEKPTRKTDGIIPNLEGHSGVHVGDTVNDRVLRVYVWAKNEVDAIGKAIAIAETRRGWEDPPTKAA